MAKRWFYITIFVGVCLSLSSCGLLEASPPIVTPGAVYSVIHGNIPLPLRDWQYDEDYMLLFFYDGRHKQEAFLYGWRTGELKKLNIPGNFVNIYQGPNNLIAYETEPDDLREDGIIHLYDVDNKIIRAVGKGGPATFSTDGRYLAVWQDYDLTLVNLEDMSSEFVFHLENPGGKRRNLIWGTDWIPESNLVSVTYDTSDELSSPSSIMIINTITGEGNTLIDNDDISAPAWSPDGRLMAYIYNPLSDDSEIRIVDIRHKCLIGAIGIDSIDDLEWSPKGDTLAFMYWSEGRLYFADVQKVFGAPYDALECPP